MENPALPASGIFFCNAAAVSGINDVLQPEV